MALINFPTSPTLYQSFTFGAKTWIWNGYAWDLQTANTVALSAYANSAYAQANAAYAQANTGGGGGSGIDNVARSTANASYASGNITASFANSAFSEANIVFAYANSAYSYANASYASENITASFANSAYTAQNITASFANSAFYEANIVFAYANSAYAQANAAYNKANTGGSGGSGLVYTANTTPPASGNNKGDQWYNTTTNVLYEWATDNVSFFWIDISSPTVSNTANVNINTTGNVNTNVVFANSVYINGQNANTYIQSYIQQYVLSPFLFIGL
jgi:hypothetical protein